MIRALQTLQLKIKKLELERVQAEKNFGSLEKEANTYKDLVNKAKGMFYKMDYWIIYVII